MGGWRPSVILLCAACCASSTTAGHVGQLFDQFWKWRLLRSPEFGSFAGVKVTDMNLETFTERRFAQDLRICHAFLKQAQQMFLTMTDPQLKLQLRYLMAELKTFIDGYESKGFYFPINYFDGLQVSFPTLVSDYVKLETIQDYKHLIIRYLKFCKLAAQTVKMMKKAIRLNRTNHAYSMKGVVDQCRIHLGAPEKTVFFRPFLNVTNIPGDQIASLKERALVAIKTSVQPGFRLLASFIQNTYMAHTRPSIAASSISPGFYEACLAFHTSTNLTAQEIHQKGLDEVARIEKQMKKIALEMGYNLNLTQFFDVLRNNKSNVFNSGPELLNAFKEILEKRIEPQLLNFFMKKPAINVTYVEVPASTPDAPSASYNAGTMDGKQPGRFYVNTIKYQNQMRYEMVSLTLHELSPGHHLQSSYTLEQQGWPLFRKIVEDIKYSRAPSRFPMHTAFMEGWALYSESLGFDMGLYNHPLDRLGHLNLEIFRACRLVVDTGMHALGWTRDQAIHYMGEHTANSLEDIKDEVDRYITLPGQATAYKIGQMKIRELRTRAENMLGAKFNIKDFHEIVLKCAGPLNILEEEIDRWIDNRLAAVPKRSGYSEVITK